MLQQALQPGFLQADIVVIVEVVEARNSVTARQQLLAEVVADKAGGAGDEDVHGAGPASLYWRRMINCFVRICIASQFALARAGRAGLLPELNRLYSRPSSE